MKGWLVNNSKLKSELGKKGTKAKVQVLETVS